MRHRILLLPLALFLVLSAESCLDSGAASEEQRVADNQQELYLRTQPIPQFDYSLQRDVYTQIYRATNEGRNTFTVVESVTGITKFACPSIGYALPADVSLTNPLQGIYITSSGGAGVVELPEPNGLYSSKNTDGTWILCVGDGGEITPIYTEHKVTTFPFFIDGLHPEWQRQAGSTATTVVVLDRQSGR